MVRRVSRPVIGVTGPDKGGAPAWWWTWWALRRAGARAVRLTPSRPWRELSGERMHGLVLGGGSDIAPEHARTSSIEMDELMRGAKDEVRKEHSFWRKGLHLLVFLPLAALRWLMRRSLRLGDMRLVDTERDHMELALLERVLGQGLPVLGICRGMQLVNAHLGGTLHAEVGLIYGEEATTSSVFPVKHVHVEPDSLLAGVVGRERLRVNALHHQAVDALGHGVRVAARDDVGIVEAIEVRERDFVLGVQWHPEFLPHMHSQRAVFRGLVRAARRAGGFSGDARSEPEPPSH